MKSRRIILLLLCILLLSGAVNAVLVEKAGSVIWGKAPVIGMNQLTFDTHLNEPLAFVVVRELGWPYPSRGILIPARGIIYARISPY